MIRTELHEKAGLDFVEHTKVEEGFWRKSKSEGYVLLLLLEEVLNESPYRPCKNSPNSTSTSRLRVNRTLIHLAICCLHYSAVHLVVPVPVALRNKED